MEGDGLRMCVKGRGDRGLSEHLRTWFQGSTSAKTPELHCQGTPAPVLLRIVSCPSNLGEQERDDRWRN